MAVISFMVQAPGSDSIRLFIFESQPQTKDIIDKLHKHGPPALLWLSNYIASHHLAVMSQSGAKINFIVYCLLHNFKSKM